MPNIGDIIKATDLQDLLEQINNNSSNIVGELKYLTYNQIPENCLMCDGSEISRETYSELFNVIGTTYGEGDGSTTFNIPDYRGAFLRCIGGNADELGVLQGDAIRNITGGIGGTNMGYFQYTNTGVLRTPSHATAPAPPNGVSITRYFHIDFNASYVVPTADENRPINYAINVCVVFE